MKVLITGAAGFLGSHLMLHHLQRGDAVLGIDNYCSSDPDSGHADLIRGLCKESGTSMLYAADIVSHLKMWEARCTFAALSGPTKFDLIYNFACPASPPRYQAMPIETLLTSVQGTENMLRLAADDRAVLVHASTSEVYGDPEHSPQHETYRGRVNSYGPRACYDEGKRAAETLCYDYLNTRGVDARMVRIFNTYGPHMDPGDGRVISNFICQALRGEPMTVYGDGKQTRSFCYVSDLIRGIVALGALASNPGGPINLGNPNEFTVGELAQRVSDKVHGEQRMISLKPLPADDPTQRCPDIGRARQLLGWEPQVMLDEGLDRTINYFRRVTPRLTNT